MIRKASGGLSRIALAAIVLAIAEAVLALLAASTEIPGWGQALAHALAGGAAVGVLLLRQVTGEPMAPKRRGRARMILPVLLLGLIWAGLSGCLSGCSSACLPSEAAAMAEMAIHVAVDRVAVAGIPGEPGVPGDGAMLAGRLREVAGGLGPAWGPLTELLRVALLEVVRASRCPEPAVPHGGAGPGGP